MGGGGGRGDRITSFSRCVALNPRHIKTASSVSRSAHNPVHRLSCTSDIHAGCGEEEARGKRESHRRCSLPSRNYHDRKHPRKASKVFFTFPLSSSSLYRSCLSVAKSCCQAKQLSAPKSVWRKKKGGGGGERKEREKKKKHISFLTFCNFFLFSLLLLFFLFFFFFFFNLFFSRTFVVRLESLFASKGLYS